MKHSTIPRSLLLCILVFTTQQTCALNFHPWLFSHISSFHPISYLKKQPLLAFIILGTLSACGLMIAKSRLFEKKSKPEENNNQQMTGNIPAADENLNSHNNEPFKTKDLIQLTADINQLIFCYYLNFPYPEQIQKIKSEKDIKEILLTLKRLVPMYCYIDTLQEARIILKNGFRGIKYFSYPEDNQAQFWYKVEPGIEQFNKNSPVAYRITIKADPRNTFVYNQFHRIFNYHNGSIENYRESKILLYNFIENKKMLSILRRMSETIKNLRRDNKELNEQLKKKSAEMDNNLPQKKSTKNIHWGQCPHTSAPIKIKNLGRSYLYMNELPADGSQIKPERFVIE